MTNYREILRMKSLGINNQQIAQGMAISRTTVIADYAAADEHPASARLYSRGGENGQRRRQSWTLTA